MAKKNTAPNGKQAEFIRRRGLDPKNYTVVKVLNYSIFLKDRRTGMIKILDKHR